MMTSSNGDIFRVTGHLCGEFTGPGEFPAQRPVTRSFGVSFDLRRNKRLNKQSCCWWFETLLRPLWRQWNVIGVGDQVQFSHEAMTGLWSISHIIMTSSNGNIFRVTALCAGNLPVTGEFPSQSLVTRSFDVFYDLCLNKRLSKQSWGWWFETPLCSLWRHCNVASNTKWFDSWNTTLMTTVCLKHSRVRV